MAAVKVTSRVKWSNALCSLQRYEPAISFRQNESKRFCHLNNQLPKVSIDTGDACHTAELQKDCYCISAQMNAAFLLANFEFWENFLEMSNGGEKTS